LSKPLSKVLRRGAGLTVCSALLFVKPAPLQSHDPITTKLTWTREISRVVYSHCAGCHRAGGSAMELTTYEAARPWAKAIRDEVLARRMPPWGAVTGVREFAGDPSLSQPEIDMLVAWVEGGAPEGDAADSPAHLQAPLNPSPALPRYSRTVNVTSETTLARPTTVVALRPKDVPERGALEAWAIEPDGTVERLLWLTDYRKVWTRSYVLREPLALPAGTRLRVSGKAGSLLYYCR
jgi:mono/diheme cytochrome c family protein